MGKVKSLTGYGKITKGRETNQKKGGGVAIFIKENLTFSEWEGKPEEDDIDIVNERSWVKIKGNKAIIALCSVYCIWV
jgi:hypothetical protein